MLENNPSPDRMAENNPNPNTMAEFPDFSNY